jgi:hypothetical protein
MDIISKKSEHDLHKLYIKLIYILFCVFIIPQIVLSQEDVAADDAKFTQGLTGILYDDTELSRPVSLWYIDLLDSKQIDWEKRNDFSAKWQGLLKAPVTGEITFIGEANNGLLLQLDGQSVLNGWDNGRHVTGKFKVVKDQFYQIYLAYRQINGPSSLKISWQWENQSKTVIPMENLWFSQADEEQMTTEYNKALEIPLDQLEFDISAIIEIESETDLLAKRNALIEVIFGDRGLPGSDAPDSVETAISDPDFEDLANLKQVNRLNIEMEWNLNSIAYHFIPEKSINKAVIYHQGHRGKFAEGKSTIQAFLNNGFDVIALSMPLKGFNRKPIVSFPEFGKLMIVTHEQMSLLNPKAGHPVQYFLEPVIIMVNYMQKLDFDDILMIGISGGGWTTTLCAALDLRISRSYPVAGSLPFYLRSRDLHNNSTFGDYEQYVPEIYRVANYLDLYVMGASGENRKQLQILNQYDSCCFGGTGYTTYVDLVKSQMIKIGSGEFDVYLDSTHREHKISDAALTTIFKDLEL